MRIVSSFTNNYENMTWWTENAVRENLRLVTYCCNSAETRQENSKATQDEKCRTFAEMQLKFQDMMKQVAEDGSFIFVPVIDVSRLKRFRDTNRRRTK